MSLYFAYGSNLSVEQMKKRCPKSELLEVGYLDGYRLGFTHFSKNRGGGVADIVKEPGSKVWGVIYKLPEDDLKRLDRCEGYPNTYTRFQEKISTISKKNIPDVWVYTVVNKKEFVPPTEEYLHIINDGAEEFGFPEDYRMMVGLVRTK